jgi:hypothetical protein
MIMMMTDSDRLALHFCLHFCFVSFTPSCQRQRPSSIGMPSLHFVTHHITPVRSSSSIHTTCFFRTSHHHLGRANPAMIFHVFSLIVVPQHLSGGTLPFLPPCSQQQPKKTCSKDHFLLPPHSLQASTRTRTFCARISMYLLPLVVFISHQKEGFCSGREASEAP